MKDRVNYYIFLPAISLLFFLETTFIAQAFWNFFPPNLVILFLMAAVFLSSSADFLHVAFAFGFLFDLLAGSNFGIFTLSFTLSSAAAYWLKMKFLKEESFARTVLVSVLAMLVYNAVQISLLFFAFDSDVPAYYGLIWKKAAFDALGAAIVVYPAMRFISNGQE